jgi:hypothetical protein
MIKKVFFMAALLVPGLAYAGSPSADLSVQVVPAGPNPAVPAPAAAAGFTTLALNADFTSPAYSNKSTFVNECGATATPRWHWTLSLTSISLSCNDISVVSDGAIPQVLHIAFPPSEWTQGKPQGALTFPGVGYQQPTPCGTSIDCYPVETYIEVVYRTSLASWNQSGSNVGDLGFYPVGRGFKPDGSYPPNDWYEADMVESLGLSTANPSHGGGWGGMINGTFNFGPVTFWNMDGTQYHKLGVLVTDNGGTGTTSAWKCTWIDDVLVTSVGGNGNCVRQLGYSPVVFSQHDNSIEMNIGTFPNSTAPVNPVEAWVQYIRVFECPGWKTGECPGTVQYGPDGSGLAYWHN